MASFKSLPCEVLMDILEQFDKIEDLWLALLICRRVYWAYHEKPSMAHRILKKEIAPHTLPFSTALIAARTLPQPQTADSKNLFLEVFRHDYSRTWITAYFEKLPLRCLLKMGRTHKIVEALVADMAADAWSVLCDENKASGDLELSTNEHRRFCNSFYRVQLFFDLFRADHSAETQEKERWKAMLYSYRHFVFENEQMACVLDFLEKRFFEASLEILTHDVEFGQFKVRCNEYGECNEPVQYWLSQGIDYLFRLYNEPSYHAKCEMLRDGYRAHAVNLYRGIRDYSQNLEYFSSEDINAPRVGEMGPRLAMRGVDIVGACHFLGHRERAYCMWDTKTLRTNYLLPHLWRRELPDWRMKNKTTDEEMMESFKARSEVYQMGGRGYWSKEDNSRIEWIK